MVCAVAVSGLRRKMVSLGDRGERRKLHVLQLGELYPSSSARLRASAAAVGQEPGLREAGRADFA